MKLQHYLGGIENLGPVSVEKKVFVEEWEKRIFGIHVAMMALSNHLDQAIPKYPIKQVPTKFKDFWTWGHLRTGAEGMQPFDYFRLRYYEKWLGGISGFFIEKGYVTEAELDAATASYLSSPKPTSFTPPAGGNPAIDTQVIRYLREGDSPKRELTTKPKFAVGSKVKVKDPIVVDHTRLPGHLRGKTGTVYLVYPDAYTYFFSTGPDGIGEPMPVYLVAFSPADIWGTAKSDPNSTYYDDLFETYLESV
ncbi:nitrile hydratase subunit beta [Pseudanabaena yagii]|uniref:nitrile hydratase n=1 Tax=Pseudanabaena yagii GIHE-NHR1 TaxID=2722753 RepID=A0ABX1LTE6_9CYAN|nr:nitrile hydratase subunit beta [Pseudanabaena yagii]NMF59422.1 nitrile hydratase subunit beta [Pseudanabaena yagii GIHE-NHR1]